MHRFNLVVAVGLALVQYKFSCLKLDSRPILRLRKMFKKILLFGVIATAAAADVASDC